LEWKIIFVMMLLSIFYFSYSVSSSDINVKIQNKFDGNITSLLCHQYYDLIKCEMEFYNKGTVPYKARVKIEIFNGSENIFTGWSNENILMSGDRKEFDAYLYTNTSGNIIVRSSVFFGDDILKRSIEIEKNSSSPPESIFEIKNLRVYENRIIFDVKSNSDINNLVVIPDDFIQGWIFEQKKIDSMNENKEKTISILYFPSVWVDNNMKMIIASEDGKYKTEEIIYLKKETGFTFFIHSIIDNVKIFLSN
jgi:hypothetical protein